MTTWNVARVGSLYVPLIERCAAEEVAVLQVKEKLGGLRFYYIGAASNDLHNAIEAAESKSFTLCEQCGDPAELRKGGGWWQTLCDRHAQDRDRSSG